MDNLIFPQKPKRNKELNCKAPNEGLTDALKIVKLDKLIQIHGEHLKTQDQMPPEDKGIQYPHNITLVFIIFFLKTLENGCFDQALFVKPFLVPQYFECNHLASFMIKAREHLAKRALANLLLNFVAIGYMVFCFTNILALIVIMAAVVWAVGRALSFAQCGLSRSI